MDFKLDNFGMARFAVVSPKMKVAATDYNTDEIISVIEDNDCKNVKFFLFPELCLTGYSCGDLFFQSALQNSVTRSIIRLKKYSAEKSISIVVGAPIKLHGKMFNTAVFISSGSVIGIVPKTYIPNSDEYYEERWFSSDKDRNCDYITIDGQEIPFGADLAFRAVDFPENMLIGMEICEDLWSVVPPSSELAISGCNVILNLSASSEYLGKTFYRRRLVENQSGRCQSAYLYSSSSSCESSTDFITSGHCIAAENGKILIESPRFNFDTHKIIIDIDIEKLNNERIKNNSFAFGKSSKQFRVVDFIFGEVVTDILLQNYSKLPFVPSNESIRNEVCQEILSIQSTALAKRLLHIGCKSVVLGISGGLDSTLALIVCLQTFDKLKLDKKGIIAISMPGFGTSPRTKSNSKIFAEITNVRYEEISINKSVLQHFDDIGHNEQEHNVVYENSQARMRTMILMNLANKHSAIVIGTGDLSEAALGWSTYNGDHISMYSVNSGVPKTLVKYVIQWAALNLFAGEAEKVLSDILNTPISPELLPPSEDSTITQNTEELVGPYELNDFFLYYFVRLNYSPSKILLLAHHAFGEDYSIDELKKQIKFFLKRFFTNQYKRSCVPDGIKIGTVSLSPRGEWRMPSDAEFAIWIDDVERFGAIQ